MINRTQIAILILPCLIGLISCISCNRPSHEIRIIIPNNYEAEIVLRESPGVGEPGEFVKGILLIQIAANGQAKLKTLRAFSEWHQLSANYMDGTRIPVVGQGATVSPTVIALRPLFLVGDQGEIRFVVGTEAQAKKIVDGKFGLGNK